MLKMTRTFWSLLIVAITLLIGQVDVADAVFVHNMNCTDCHKNGAAITTLTNVCVVCHVDGNTTTMKDLSVVPVPGDFNAASASNALGSHSSPSSAPGAQTSHYWGGTPTNKPAAGSVNPPTTFYTSRYTISTGKTTCSMCHDPHKEAGTMLLRAGTADDLICRQCHTPFYVDLAYAQLTHPVGATTTYATIQAANPTKYKAATVDANGRLSTNTANADIRLVNGYLACTSCHGVHYADSNSSTPDGIAYFSGLAAGDGNILRADGPAIDKSKLCQTCHTYKAHGGSGETVGCLVCHSAHVYTATGTPNYFVLRKDVSTTLYGAKSGLNYTTLPTPWNGAGPDAALVWADGAVASTNGYCEKCHGDVSTMAGSARTHTEGENCRSCHAHDRSGGIYSFEGTGCDGCHGYPPATNVPTTGYAVDSVKGYNYSTSGVFKDESLTPHASHSGTGSGYNFACANCHNGNFATTHDQNSFQDVLAPAGSFQTVVKPAGSGLNPSYTLTGNGSCSNVGCHSNGGKRTGDGTRTYKTTTPAWGNAKNSITTCDACHGNSVATMAVAQRDNSTSHIAHLNYGYSCNICHTATATNATTLKAGAAGTVHLDGTVEVGFGGFAVGSYAQASGTCSVTCHMTATPDWDVATSGDCGTCHDITGATLGGAHNVHTVAADGPMLACTICHTNNGSGSEHVNGVVSLVASYQTAVCNGCHGATGGQTTGNDRQPIWADAASVDCATCHIGALAVINTKTAPNKTTAITTGHNRTTATGNYPVSNNLAANKTCTDCHDSAAVGHFDATSGDDQRLQTGFTCDSCHGSAGTAVKKNVVTHQAKNCTVCHDVHGGSNIYMINTTSTDYSGTVVFTALSGANSYDEDDNADGGVTEVNADDLCATCHTSAAGTTHNNKENTDNQAPAGHNIGTDCFSCHKAHTNAGGAFITGAGTACNDCHGNPPATGAHALHSIVANNTVTEDRTDCAYCHTGANLYTYDLSADQAAGRNHSNATGRRTILGTTVGYNSTNKNCTSACHASTVADGAWNDTALNCDSCHGNAPADGGGDGLSHSKHVAAGQTCAVCHVSVPTDTTHISIKTGASDLAKIQNTAQALADEANVVVANWNDTNNTCANAACHNPSNDGKLADWDTSVSSCILCHRNDVASGQAMQTAGHTSHVNNAAIIGNNIACTACHPNAGSNMAHRNGTLQVNAVLNYNGELAIPNTAYGTCNSTVCHYDPLDKLSPATPGVTSLWNFNEPSDCGICHNAMPGAGDHTMHMDATRIAKGMGCVSCHADSVLTNTTIKPGGKHLDNSRIDVVVSGNYNGTAITLTYNSVPNPSSCTTNCHSSNPKNWVEPTSCESCHGDLTYVGGAHAKHIDITGSIDADLSECAFCHGDLSLYSLVPAGLHQNGTKNLVAGISNTTCTAACHVSTAGVDGFWTDANRLSCNACHANPPADSAHATHIAASMVCSDCHGTVDAPGAVLTHNHAKDVIGAPGISNIESLQTKGKDYINPTGLDVVVDDAAFNAGAGATWLNSALTTDAGNYCTNTYCHDPSNAGARADWDDDNSACSMCHGDDQVGTAINSGSHSQHLNANTKFGVTVTCTQCHPNNAGNNAHFFGAGATTLAKLNKTVKFNGTIITTQYQGEVALPSTGVGTCSANQCHNNGKGLAAITSFNWGTPVASDCQFCHDDPPVTGRHSTHLGTTVTYGPYAGVASTNCGDCHDANNNLTMTGKTTHMNGAINFTGGQSVATGGIVANVTVTSCNTCHGAQAATANANSALAKAQWNTANRLSCESCHGDFGSANSKANGTGITAQSRAGTNYDSKGHGKVPKACNECHDSAVAHISGVANDANRLQLVGGNNYSILAQANAWCSACHATTMYGHFANTQTAGGSSEDALYCSTCHDPHGQSGQDAMVASLINGNPVSGFTDRNVRGSYSNAGYTGVCQVCHDGTEVPHFNRTTDESAHQSPSICTSCHKHTDNPSFQASGCNGCHGGGYAVAPLNNNYWPDSTNARVENTAGRHAKHMQRLALSKYNETLDQLLTDNTAGNPTLSSDEKQKVLCAYCHANPGTDADHSLTMPAEVNSMANLWNPGTVDNAVWTVGSNSGNCSNVNCHNNLTTPTGYGWYGPNASACTMCHVAGNADDLVNNNIQPNSGLHKVVNSSTVQAHNHTLVGPPGSSGCTSCHDSVQPSTHINGIAVADGVANTDRFLKNADVAFTDGAFNQSSCGATSGLIAGCHSDGGHWKRLWSKEADSTDTALGSPRCNVCHGQPPGGSSMGWRTGLSVNHNLTNINDTSKHNNCEYCHVAPAGPYNEYVYATHHENDLVEYNNGAGVGYIPAEGSCQNFCHPSGQKKTMSPSTIWAENPINGASPTCGDCHDSTGGALLPPYDTTIGYGGGSHDKHVFGAASVYADTGNNSTAANYNYGCANCHPNSITNHFNGTIDVSLNSSHGGPLKSKNTVANDTGGFTASGPRGARTTTCTAAYCHSDGKGNFLTTPNWYGGTFVAADPCANCHLNSPDGTSHNPHNVGIHYNNVYTGTVDVVKDTATRQNAHGSAGSSTTISCQICHWDTVQDKVNARNTVCATCHTTGGDPAVGNAVVSIANKQKHVSGTADVQFQNISVLSRAQLREPLANAPEVNDNWKRMNGYKVNNTSHDETWDTNGTNLTRPLDTALMYDPATKNCTVACHNNIQIGWGATTISCSNCHSQLPK